MLMRTPRLTTTEPPVKPLAPLIELARWLNSTTLHMAIGVLAGLVAAHLMRRHHLRWTWAVSALALAVMARSVFKGWSWSSTLDIAALSAAARGRHLHREDLLAGGDLAEIASAR